MEELQRLSASPQGPEVMDQGQVGPVVAEHFPVRKDLVRGLASSEHFSGGGAGLDAAPDIVV